MSFEHQPLQAVLPDLFSDDLLHSPGTLGVDVGFALNLATSQGKGLGLEKTPELNTVKRNNPGVTEGYITDNSSTNLLNRYIDYADLSLPNAGTSRKVGRGADEETLTGSFGVNLAVAQDFTDKQGHSAKTLNTKQGSTNNSSNGLHLGVGSQPHVDSGNHGKPDASTSTPPTTSPTPPKIGFGNGLEGEYFNGKDLSNSVLVRTDAVVNFDWKVGSPDPAVDTNRFSVRWTGFVQPLYDEQYTFFTQSDDGMRLWVNDQLLVDHWQNGNAKEWSGVINLEAGEFYSIKLEYFEQGGQARSSLLWASESQVKQVIPTSQLYTDLDQPFIGVIDTGFAANNPDFNYNRIMLGQDRVGNDANPLLADGEGNEHGTHILGLIAATQNNGLGIDGMNNNAPLWVGRAIGDGEWAQSLREYVDAFLASDWKNGVINLSFDLIQRNADGTLSTRYELTPEERGALEYARQNGVLIVAAAGNNGGVMSVLGQASQEFDNIITVGAADGVNRANYSSYGYGLDILANGGTVENPVLSTVADGVGTMAGTSVATAIATGVASRVWHENPELSYRQVIEILKTTATDLNTPGWDLETGAGLVDMTKAIAKAKDTTPEVYDPVDFSTPTTWSGAGLVTPLERAVGGEDNTRETARNIGTLTSAIQVFNDRIDNSDTEDFYSFYVAEPGTANISITNLSGNARVEFFKGSSAYPSLSSTTGFPQYVSTAYIDEPGQYFLRIAQDFTPKDTDYTLQLSATSSVMDIGSLSGTRNVATTDKFSFYRFKLDQNSVVKASSNYPNLIILQVRDTSYKNAVSLDLNAGQTLNAGTYYLAVSNNPESGQPVPSSFSLNLQATATTRYDNAGINYINALDLGTITGSKSVVDFLDATDLLDNYSFTIDQKSSLNLNLVTLSGKMDVGVNIFDINRKSVAFSSGYDAPFSPIITTLEPGKYFVSLTAWNTSNAQYRLDLQTQALVANDAIGNTLAQAKDLGMISPSYPITAVKDAIGDTDSADWFRFNTNKLGNILPALDGLTTPVSLELMRIESNGVLTSLGTLNSNGASNWQPAFNNLPVGNYALVLTSTSTISSPYTLNMSAVSTNTAPTNFKLNLGGTYSSNQDIIVTGSVYDVNGANDLDEVWVNINGQTYFVKNFTPSSSDPNVANFSLNIGKLPIGSYGWSGGSYDKSRDSSGVTLTAGTYPVNVVYAPIDTAGDTEGTARDLGTITQATSVSEYVGTTDRADIYRFVVPTTSYFTGRTTLTFQLDGLSGDADFSIYKALDSGAKISYNSPIYGTGIKTFTSEFEAGTYFVEVYNRDGTINTNYNLSITPPTLGTFQFGQSVSGDLTNTDPKDLIRSAFYDDYSLSGFTSGQQVRLTLTASGFVPKIYLIDALTGQIQQQSTVIQNGNQSVLDFVVPTTGNYAVRVASDNANQTGSYTLESGSIPVDNPNSGGGLTGSILLGMDASGNQYSAFTTANDYYGVNGVPTSSVYRSGNGYIQEMQGLDGFGKYYLMLEDGASRAFLLGGDPLNYYLNNGGVGRFGYPVSEVIVDPRSNFSTQYFENGSLVMHDGAVYGYDASSGGSTGLTGTLPRPTYRITETVNEAKEWHANLFQWDRNNGTTPPVDFYDGGSNNPNWIGTLNLGSNSNKNLKFDWGTGTVKGNANLPADGFAIRAYTWADFDGGKYQFNVRADDGFQLLAKRQSDGKWFYITPQDQWQNAGYGNLSTVTAQLPKGRYDLHIHYFEHGGEAKMDFSWGKVTTTNPVSSGGSSTPTQPIGSGTTTGGSGITSGSSSTLPIQYKDDNTLEAHSIGSLFFGKTYTYNDSINISDPQDYYSFTVDQRSRINLSLDKLTGNADLYLLTNSSDLLGKVLIHSSATGNYDEQISQVLDPGTYYIRVDQGVFQAQANYELNLSLSNNIGILSIDSSSDSSSSSAINITGHSWLSYDIWISYNEGTTEKVVSNETTFGTWGNNPIGLGNGLFENIEKDRKIQFQVERSTTLDAREEKILFSQIDVFKKQGSDAWKYTFPCSGFAKSVWKTVTKEDLTSEYEGSIVTPTALKWSIYLKNGKSSIGTL